MNTAELRTAEQGCRMIIGIGPEPPVEKYVSGYLFRVRKELEARDDGLPEEA